VVATTKDSLIATAAMVSAKDGGLQRRVGWYKFTDVSEVSTASIIAISESTRRYNTEDGHLHTHRRENLRSYLVVT
jgi:hypothetical protein